MGSPDPADRVPGARAVAGTLLVGCALALGTAGCGGDDDESADRGARTETTETAPTAVGRSETQTPAASPAKRREARQVRRTVVQLYSAVGRKDPRSLCALMTKSDRDATARYTTSKTCEEGAKKLMVRTKARGNPQVVGVNIDGDRATASVRFGNGPVNTVPMARQDGTWKIAGNTPAKPTKSEKQKGE